MIGALGYEDKKIAMLFRRIKELILQNDATTIQVIKDIVFNPFITTLVQPRKFAN